MLGSYEGKCEAGAVVLAETIPRYAVQDQAESGSGVAIFLALVGVVLVPSAMMRAFGVSSLAAGSVALATAFLGARVLRRSDRVRDGASRRRRPSLYALGAAVLLVATHSAVAAILSGRLFETERCLFSMGALSWVVLGASQFHVLLRRVCVRTGRRALLSALGVVGAIGGAAIVAMHWGAASKNGILGFMEPSHFGIASMYLLAPALVLSRGWVRWAIGAGAVVFALGLESLTMLVAAVLCLALVFSWRAIVPIMLAILVMRPEVRDSYYIDRVNMSGDTTNLSALVWLQGMQTASIVLGDSFGVGVGFQQLGASTVTGEAAGTIKQVFGGTLNERDGGLLGAKVVAEMGILGLALLAVYGWTAFRALVKIRTIVHGTGTGFTFAEVVGACSVVMYSVELCVRGVGYFSPGVFFAVVPVYTGWIERSSARKWVEREKHPPTT